MNHNPVHDLVLGKIYGAFTLHMKLAFYAGLVIAMPVLVWQIWGFVVPALPSRFYRFGPYVMFAGILLVLCAAASRATLLCRWRSTSSSAREATNSSFCPMPRAISVFVALIIIVFGLSYELPLILVMLSVAGITNSGWRWRKRVIAFFVIFAVAAVITPGALPAYRRWFSEPSCTSFSWQVSS